MHSRSPDFRVVCGIDGCASEYRVYNSYYYHIKRKHTHHLLQTEEAEEQPLNLNGTPRTPETTATSPLFSVNSSETVCGAQGIPEAPAIITQLVSNVFLCLDVVCVCRKS